MQDLRQGRAVARFGPARPYSGGPSWRRGPARPARGGPPLRGPPEQHVLKIHATFELEKARYYFRLLVEPMKSMQGHYLHLLDHKHKLRVVGQSAQVL